MNSLLLDQRSMPNQNPQLLPDPTHQYPTNYYCCHHPPLLPESLQVDDHDGGGQPTLRRCHPPPLSPRPPRAFSLSPCHRSLLPDPSPARPWLRLPPDGDLGRALPSTVATLRHLPHPFIHPQQTLGRNPHQTKTLRTKYMKLMTWCTQRPRRIIK